MFRRLAEHPAYVQLINFLRRSHAHRWLPWVILVASLAITYLVWQHARQNAQQELKKNFSFQVNEAGSRIEERLRDYEQVLRGGESLYAASLHVEREEFHTYANKIGRASCRERVCQYV